MFRLLLFFPRIIYIRFNSKLPYLLHRIKNHNNEAANQKRFVETFGHLYGIHEAFIGSATNKSALFWSSMAVQNVTGLLRVAGTLRAKE